ncbi:MAG: RNA methyltransferase [Vicingaceae bacterium]|nr:RNA methyltransferase [Vicingaceae bacterium]
MTHEKKLLEHLLTFISENKRELFFKIIEERTQHCTVILEDIFQPQNASAVLRSCDVFGIQNVHVIENRNTYNVNPKVVQGASKWLNINKYNELENNTLFCINALKNKGYKIYATSPHATTYLIQDIPIDTKFALLFGTEKEGLSEIALSNADELVKIPMVGFTESLNISVSAAICLYEVTKRLHESTIDWQLNEKEKVNQLIQWTKKVIKRGEAIERAFLKAP